jgi:hypothetical protein
MPRIRHYPLEQRKRNGRTFNPNYAGELFATNQPFLSHTLGPFMNFPAIHIQIPSRSNISKTDLLRRTSGFENSDGTRNRKSKSMPAKILVGAIINPTRILLLLRIDDTKTLPINTTAKAADAMMRTFLQSGSDKISQSQTNEIAIDVP